MVTFHDVIKRIEFCEEFRNNYPKIFKEVDISWRGGNPIHASFNEVKEFIVRSNDVRKILDDAITYELYSGGIFSIYSEKNTYGMGKSQIALFLLKEFDKQSGKKLTRYHVFSPDGPGFEDFKHDLSNYFQKCNEETKVYFFVDEMDLLIDPDMSREEIVKRLEKFTNILFGVLRKVDQIGGDFKKPFYVFLVMSRLIQNEMDKHLKAETDRTGRLKRRLESLVSVDFDLELKDFENFALNLFATYWVGNWGLIQDKLNARNQFKFKEHMALLISHLSRYLPELNLKLKSSVIGDLVVRLKNLFQNLFRGINNDLFTEVYKIFASRARIGNKIETLMKEYLERNSIPSSYTEGNYSVLVEYKTDLLQVGEHKSDGYYQFLVGEEVIGKIPVEITTEEKLGYRKKKQIVTFSKEFNTILIWIYPGDADVKKTLDGLDNKAIKKIYRVLIPLDLAKYALFLVKYQYKFLEMITREQKILNFINNYLERDAKISLKKWILDQDIDIKDKPDEVISERIRIFLDVMFNYIGENKKSHGKMMVEFKIQLKKIYSAFEIAVPRNLDEIYYEMIHELKKKKICSFRSTDRSKFLSKIKPFDTEKAIDTCSGLFISRIKEHLKNKGQ